MHQHPRNNNLTPRLQCLVELKKQEQEQRMLEKLAEGVLPKELVMRILGEVIESHGTYLMVTTIQHVTEVAVAMLGHSAAQSLYDMCTQAILETMLIRLDVQFTKNAADGNTMAHLPTVFFELPCRIRHLEIYFEKKIGPNVARYPVELYRLTDGMSSLMSQLPTLKSLKIIIAMDVDDASFLASDFLDIACFAGFSKMTTYKAVIGRLVNAMREHGPAKMTTLQLNYKERYEDEWEADYMEVSGPEDTEETVVEIVRGAECLEPYHAIQEKMWKEMVQEVSQT